MTSAPEVAATEFTHGVQGYGYQGCRCEVCRAANTARGRQMRANLRARVDEGSADVPHGTAGGYSNWGCRCERCTAANTAAGRAGRRARQNPLVLREDHPELPNGNTHPPCQRGACGVLWPRYVMYSGLKQKGTKLLKFIRRRFLAPAAIIPIALGLAAGVAFAAVSGTPVASVNGNGGYDATTTNAAGFTDTQSVITGGQYGLTVDAGAHGVQLCNHTSNLGAQVGLLSDNLKTTYHVASAVGTIPNAGCPTGGVLPAPVDFPNLTAVPFGHRVWVDASLIHKVKTYRVLVCVIKIRSILGDHPLYPDQAPPVGIVPGPGFFGGFHCFFKTITVNKNVVVFLAQDLDAPTAVPVTGDLAGVQARYVHVPTGTVFTDAGAGVNENLTKLVACAGNGFPKTLAGPAAYVTAACQPISAFDHTTATVAAGAPTGLSALTTTEGVSPTAALPGALIAPDNTLAVTPGTTPPGTAVNASTNGDSFTMFSGNAPTS